MVATAIAVYDHIQFTLAWRKLPRKYDFGAEDVSCKQVCSVASPIEALRWPVSTLH